MPARRFLLYSLLAAVIGLLLAGGGYWSYWNFYARFQPVLITKNQADIQKLLDESGWISPGKSKDGPWIYVIGSRSCDACAEYEREEFPKLQAANVDTRVVVFARPAREGLTQSTPTERTTIAALWLDRDWSLYQRWKAVTSRAWTAEGLKPADGDIARTAVVAATGAFSEQLQTYLRGNNVDGAYPMVLWRDQDGFLKACACSDKRSWHFIRKDLNAPDKAPKVIDENAAVPPPAAAPVPPALSPEALPAEEAAPVEAAPAAAAPATAQASAPTVAATPPAAAQTAPAKPVQAKRVAAKPVAAKPAAAKPAPPKPTPEKQDSGGQTALADMKSKLEDMLL